MGPSWFSKEKLFFKCCHPPVKVPILNFYTKIQQFNNNKVFSIHGSQKKDFWQGSWESFMIQFSHTG